MRYRMDNEYVGCVGCVIRVPLSEPREQLDWIANHHLAHHELDEQAHHAAEQQS